LSVLAGVEGVVLLGVVVQVVIEPELEWQLRLEQIMLLL